MSVLIDDNWSISFKSSTLLLVSMSVSKFGKFCSKLDAMHLYKNKENRKYCIKIQVKCDNLLDLVVVEQKRLEFGEQRKAVQTSHVIISEIDRVKLI